MAIFPGAPLVWIERRLLKADPVSGDLVPNDSGLLYSFEAGTSTPQPLYSDSDLTLPWANPIILDQNGQPPGPVYMLPTGYRIQVNDSSDVPLYAVDNQEDVGQVFANTVGTVFSAGSKNVTSGYQVLTTDWLVTVSSTGGSNPCVIQLPAASTYTGVLTIKNLGTIALAVTPAGLDTLETLISTAYTVPAAASPSFPSIILYSDNVSAWFVAASHKVP